VWNDAIKSGFCKISCIIIGRSDKDDENKIEKNTGMKMDVFRMVVGREPSKNLKGF